MTKVNDMHRHIYPLLQASRANLNAEILGDSGGLSSWGASSVDRTEVSIGLLPKEEGRNVSVRSWLICWRRFTRQDG